jgi:quercetin dioxygenase-like cupin family protein
MASERGEAVRYRWSEIPQDHPLEGIDRRRIFGEKMMLAEVVLRRGCSVATHHHENEQIAYVVSGKIRFVIGPEDSAESREITVEGGEVMHLPSNVPHSAVALEDSLVLDLFSPPGEMGVDRT